ncbi:MAG: hypothetical protein ACR2QV_15860 [Gammaproteobacteria bacterium]
MTQHTQNHRWIDFPERRVGTRQLRRAMLAGSGLRDADAIATPAGIDEKIDLTRHHQAA